MAKTIVFYGDDSKAAEAKHKKPETDSVQIVQADAYQGERMEGDEIAFMDDVSAGQRARIESLWGKFDNRVSHDPAKVGGASHPSSLGGVPRTPGSDRGNLTDKYRTDDPNKTEAKELEHSGLAPKAEARPEPGSSKPKTLGTDGVTGKPVEDRNKTNR